MPDLARTREISNHVEGASISPHGSSGWDGGFTVVHVNAKCLLPIRSDGKYSLTTSIKFLFLSN